MSERRVAARPSVSRRTIVFESTAVRRPPRGERSISWRSLSREVVDLIAEADDGVHVDVVFQVDASTALARLHWSVASADDRVEAFVGELVRLIEPYFRVSAPRNGRRRAKAAKGRVAVVPSALLPESSGPLGFGQKLEASGRAVLSQGTDAGPDDLTAALLAEPDLRYRVSFATATSSAREIAAHSRRLLTERPDVATNTFATLREIGRPVRCCASLEMTSGRPVPARARAAIRSWFDDVQLVTDRPRLVSTTAGLATSLLRLPTFDDQTWHGFAAETWREVPVALTGATPADDMDIRIGSARDAVGRSRDISLSQQDLLRHIHVMGQTGTGKSSLLAAIVNGAAARGYGVLVLDPHAALIDRILQEMPATAADRTWLVSPGDVQSPVRLNPLAVAGPDQIATVIQDLTEIFYALFDPRHTGIVGPRFEQYLRMSLRSLVELVGSRASFADVPRILRDIDTMRAVMELIDDPDVKDFWRNELGPQQNRSEVVAWVTSKFDSFMGTPQMESLLATGADSFDPARAMDDGRIVLLDLDRSRLGLIGSRLAGLLYLTRFWTAAFTRTSDRPFLIVVDEAHTFTATALPAVAAEGRKFGLGLVVAHQHPDQLDTDLREALDGNAGTTIALRSGRDAAQSLVHRVQPEFDIDDLAELPDLTAAVVSTRHQLHPQPFTLFIDHNDRIPRVAGVGRRIDAIARRTKDDLVEPHLNAGYLDTSAIRAHAAEVVRRRAEAARPSRPPRVAGHDASFLDEWIDARRSREDSANGEQADTKPVEEPA